MKIRSLTPMEEQKVLENDGLVHYILKSYQFNPRDYDDLAQIGRIGLIKAVMTFDENRKITFATYAARVIHNELRMYFRKDKRTWKEVSINTVLKQDFDGEEMTWENVLFDEKSTDFEENIEKVGLIAHCISIILNCFSNRDAIILLYAMADVNQSVIGEKLGISQSYVSRKIAQLRKKLKKYVKQEKTSKTWISVEAIGGYFYISIPMNLFVHREETYEELYLQITRMKKPVEAKVTIEEKRVNISLPMEEEYFVFVADILYEMEYFHGAHVESTVDENDSNAQKEMLIDIPNVEVHEEPIEAEHEEVVEECEQSTKKITKTEQIRKYMSAMETFTLKQIKREFPEAKLHTIMYAIRTAEMEGLIERTSRGNYRGLKKFS